MKVEYFNSETLKWKTHRYNTEPTQPDWSTAVHRLKAHQNMISNHFPRLHTTNATLVNCFRAPGITDTGLSTHEQELQGGAFDMHCMSTAASSFSTI